MSRNKCRALIALLSSPCLVLTALASQAESYRYDPAGRLTQVVYPDGTTLAYSYDSRSNALSKLISEPGADSDGDGLLDSVESLTGVFLDSSNTGTDPLVADSDGDGAEDGLEVALGFDPLDALSTPSPPAVPALSASTLALLALLFIAVAAAVARWRQRLSTSGHAARSLTGWIALGAAAGLLAPEPATATCGEVIDTAPGSWNTQNVNTSGGALEAAFSEFAGFGTAEQVISLASYAGAIDAAGNTTATLSFTLETQTAGFGGFHNEVDASLVYDFRSAAGGSLASQLFSVEGTTSQSFNVAIANVPDGTRSVRIQFSAGYHVFYMAGTEARMQGYSLVIDGIDTSVCGDGIAECNEACDQGPANSDAIADACRTSCTLPSCGDGVTDTGEECDGGANCTIGCQFAAPAEESATAAAFAQSATAGDPVNTLTGELLEHPPADLVLGGPTRLAFVRDYASERSRSGSPTGPLGRGWLHNFEMSLDDSSGDAEIEFLFGRPISFSAGSSGWELQSPSNPLFQLVDDGTDRVLLDPGSSQTYRFDSAGALVSIADRNANTLMLSYTGGALTGISDGLGRSFSLAYNGDGNLASLSDGSRTVSYQVDGPAGAAPGDLTAVSNAAGETTLYTTDGAGRILQREDPAGTVPYAQTYDAEGRTGSQTSARSATSLISYGASSTEWTDALGGTQQDSYDADGNLSQRIDPLSGATAFTYDTSQRRTSTTNPEGSVTSYAYDTGSGFLSTRTGSDAAITTYSFAPSTDALGLTFHDVSRIDHPDGSFETFSTDTSGNVTSHTGRTGAVTNFAYNARGQLLSVTNSLAASATFIYNADASLASATTASGDTTTYAYDGLRRPATVTLPDGATLTFSYDSVDRLTGATDSRGASGSTLHDTNGRPTSVTDRLGNTSTLSWDSMNQLSSLTNPLGQTSSATYDDLERLTSLTNGAGETSSFGRDAGGRMTSVTDSGGQTWTHSYDFAGILQSSTSPQGRTTLCQTDAVGRITRLTSPLGSESDFSYDAMGRLTTWTDPLERTTHIQYTDGGRVASTSLPGGIASASYSYNALDQVTQLSDPSGNLWAFAYDNQGRATGSTDPLGRQTTFSYDTRNRASDMTFPEALGGVAYSYDSNGNLVQALFSDTTNLVFGYDALDRLTSSEDLTRSYDASGRLSDGNGLSFTHDAAGRLQTVTYAPGKTVSYAYDASGRLASVTDWQGAALTLSWHPDGDTDTLARSNGIDTTWNYDDDRRVTLISHGALASVALSYDAADQLIGTTRSGPQSAATPETATATQSFDAASQLASAAHDALGRQTQDGARSYSWDLASRLTALSEGASSAQFEYDGLGRRTARTEGGITRSYAWNDALSLPSVAIETEAGADLRYFVHAPDGTLLYSIEATDNSRRYYHFDETGNTTLLTDNAGAVVASYAYGPYGDVHAATPGVDNVYTWQGQQGVSQEGNEGLYYARARWYDSARSRFLSRDPATSRGARGSNPYLYAFANPLGFSDPRGLYPTSPDVWWGLSVGSMSGSSAADAAKYGSNKLGRGARAVSDALLNRGVEPLVGSRGGTRPARQGVWELISSGSGKEAVRLQETAASWSKYAKAAGKIGKVFDVTGGVFTAVSEFSGDTRNRTIGGRGTNALLVGSIDTLMGINPATGLATLVSHSIDNLVSYGFGDKYRPGVHEILYNTGRVFSSLFEDIYYGTGASWRLAEEMSSGKLGGATKFLAKIGEGIADGLYDFFTSTSDGYGDDDEFSWVGFGD